MSEHSYKTTIDSDMGPLNIKVTYEVHQGQKGDWHTETIEPSINITNVELVSLEEGKAFDDFLEHLAIEIEEHEQGV